MNNSNEMIAVIDNGFTIRGDEQTVRHWMRFYAAMGLSSVATRI